MENSSSGGTGFFGLLLIVFIVLKLLGKINWSWWWVMSPMWVDAILIVIVCFVYAAVRESADKNKK